MTIRQLINKHLALGRSLRDARNLAAEEIILRKIASSEMASHVTLKGGIVMYNLAKTDRRVTQDIDFDLLRYSIGKTSIEAMIRKMDAVNDGFRVAITGEIEELRHEDYHGVRIRAEIKDADHGKLQIKLDIGVHTYWSIGQENLAFHFETDDGGVSLTVNPPEQICAEKLISLARLGALSTRYKDLYDLYFLIEKCGVSAKRTGEILQLFFDNSRRKPKDLYGLEDSIESALSDPVFLAEASRPAAKWIDVSVDQLKNAILDFVRSL